MVQRPIHSNMRPGLLQQFLAAVTENPASLGVHVQAPLGRRGDGHADEAEIEITAEALFALTERFFRSLPLGDVGVEE